MSKKEYIFRKMHQPIERYINPLTEIRFFEAAEIAKFSREEKEAYEESLKYYRDLNNVVNTSREEGREEGRAEGREKGRKERNLEIAKELKRNGVATEIIIQSTGLTKKEIEEL